MKGELEHIITIFPHFFTDFDEHVMKIESLS